MVERVQLPACVAILAELEDAHERLCGADDIGLERGISALDKDLAHEHELLLALAVETSGESA